jgi:5-methylthioadenosine/S-adenosylhomocysteine deaminase
MSSEILISGGHVVTVDEELGDIPNGDVLVRDGVIAEIGVGLAGHGPDTQIVDARGRLVLPGLVDTHRHVWQGALAGSTPQMTRYGYRPAVLNGIALDHTPSDIHAGTLWGALQALNAGITTVGDWAHALQSPEHADGNLRGLQESGIRGCFFYGGPGPASDDPNPPHPLDARRMRDEHFPGNRVNGRLRMGLGLRGPASTSAERNAEDFAFARELGLPISIHVGMSGTADAVAILQRDGLLGADVNYVHGNQLTDEQLGLIAASGGSLSITPGADMLMQFGTFPPTGRALAHGLSCGFGVDTVCSTGTDLFSEMRLALAAERSYANAAALSRNEQVKAVELNQRDMLRLATIGGAGVLGLDHEIGTLTPGKQADIVIVDLRSPHLEGFGDPVVMLGLGAGPADVETVLVSGDFVKRDGRLVGPHVSRARDAMRETQLRLRPAADRYLPGPVRS